MGELITLGIGTSGSRIASSFWDISNQHFFKYLPENKNINELSTHNIIQNYEFYNSEE